jgi:hypothetical protein
MRDYFRNRQVLGSIRQLDVVKPHYYLVRETFDYTIDDQLNGKSGGTGWASNWVASNSPIKSAISGNDNKVITPTSTTSSANRFFSHPDSGIIRFIMYVRKSNSTSMLYWWIENDGVQYAFVFRQGIFNEVRGLGSSYSVTNPFTSTNTWYKTEIYINTKSTTNNILFKVNDSTIKTLSGSVSINGNWKFEQQCSGYTTGISWTDITITDN